MREAVQLAALIGDGEAVLFPGLIEERNKAVIENVEKVAQRPVVGPQAFGDETCVPVGKRPHGPHQAEEVNLHLVGLIRVPFERLNLAGRESQ